MKKSFGLSILVFSMLLACKSISLTATPTPVTPVPEIILTEVLQKFDDCRSERGVVAGDNTYSFNCYNSADTSYGVSITRFDSEAAAKAEFELSRGENPVLCFHGYDLYETLSENPGNQYIVWEDLGWQAGQWIVSVSTSYDYAYYHFSASGFSEAVYTSGVEHDLFPAGTCP